MQLRAWTGKPGACAAIRTSAGSSASRTTSQASSSGPAASGRNGSSGGARFARIPGARQTPAGYAKTEWDNQWVYGIVHPAVKSLTLVNMDCSTRELPLDEDGVFNYVAGRKQIEKGELQWKLIGRGAGGEVLAEREVSIGLTRNAKNAGHPVPVPRQDCRWRAE
jgi:hypothetical protein